MKQTHRRLWATACTVAALALSLSADEATDYRNYVLQVAPVFALLIAGLVPYCAFTRSQIQRATQQARNNHPTNHKKGN